MSQKVLQALVGEEAFRRMAPDEVSRLCALIDKEILRDDEVRVRLLKALEEATAEDGQSR